jgi:2'-5' RNA ligase
MTLHFLGASSREQEQCYADVISRIDFEPIEINLDYIGAWGNVGSRWLGCSAPPAALAALVSRLGQALAGCGYQPEKRSFIPHVTISHKKEKNQGNEAGLAAIRWLARDLVLAESVTDADGVRYRVRARRVRR